MNVHLQIENLGSESTEVPLQVGRTGSETHERPAANRKHRF